MAEDPLLAQLLPVVRGDHDEGLAVTLEPLDGGQQPVYLGIHPRDTGVVQPADLREVRLGVPPDVIGGDLTDLPGVHIGGVPFPVGPAGVVRLMGIHEIQEAEDRAIRRPEGGDHPIDTRHRVVGVATVAVPMGEQAVTDVREHPSDRSAARS